MKSAKLTDYDMYLFHQGNLFHSHHMLGAHLAQDENGEQGFRFSVWAPNAKKISLLGNFNNWNGISHPLHKLNTAGIWSCFVPNIEEGESYKYEITTNKNEKILKSDPFAFYSELRPDTASKTYSLKSYKWKDEKWIKNKLSKNILEEPMLIYEVHLGSWRKKDNDDFYSYRDLAHELIPYIKQLGYTHVELLPIMEHPLDKSWGYQTTGYFSVTSRYGTPVDLMYFIDTCHQHDIGVLLDWVPSHFCKDNHGLRLFDGTPLYEYSDERKAEKRDWGTLTFDFGKPEVQSFLISNAFFWLDLFHIDGLRVDAVSSMIYLNYNKPEHEKMQNEYGGEENLEAISFLKKLNTSIFEHFPNTYMMAEEATAWPLVTAPSYLGGLGFNFKWNMGWMNDMLKYMEMDPIHRKWHHQLITFSFFYAFSENFILPLSHDEVVHGKKSLLNKMPGDFWKKFANLRLFLGYFMTHPGKKLLFMGGEFGQYDEWKDFRDLDWEVLDYETHQSMQHYVKTLNHFYQKETALWELDHSEAGFEWIDPHDYEQSVISFIRKGKEPEQSLVIICNFTPIVRYNYHIGVPMPGTYKEIFNSDRTEFGGSGEIHDRKLFSEPIPWHNQNQRLTIKVPPLAIIILKREELQERKTKIKVRNSKNLILSATSE